MPIELSPAWLAQAPPKFQTMTPEKQQELLQRFLQATMFEQPEISIDPANSTIKGSVDTETGAPYKTRAAVQFAHTPADKLATLRKTYPEAQAYGEGNFVIPDWENQKWTQMDPSSFEPGDIMDFAPEAAEYGGSAGGALLGSLTSMFTGPAGPIAGAGVGGSLAREGADELAKRYLGTVDTRSTGDRLLDAAITGGFNAGGQALGMAAPGAVRAIFGPRDRSAARELQEDFRGANVRPSAGTITGNRATQYAERAAGALPGGGRVMQDLERGQADDMAAELQRIIQEGTGVDPRGLTPGGGGEHVKLGSKEAQDIYGTTRAQMYKEGFDIVGDQTPMVNNMAQIQAYRDQLEQRMLDANGMLDDVIRPQLNEIDKIIGTPDNPKQQMFGPMREKRTQLSEDYANPPVGWSGGSNKKFTRDLRKAITGDLKETASYMGGGEKMAAADKYMADFMQGPAPTLEQIDKLSNEQAYRWVASGAKMDAERLIQLKRVLPRERWDQFRATFIDQLGHPTPGASGALENNPKFSVQTFLKNYDEANFTPQAKMALFGNTAADRQGVALRTALDRLVRVAKAAKGAAQTRNVSNTAPVMTGAALLTSIGNDVVSGNAKSAMGTVVGGVLAPYITGKMMASPRFVNWLVGAREAAGASPKALGPWIGRLAAIGGAEPALKGDVTQLIQAMLGQGSSGSSQQ